MKTVVVENKALNNKVANNLQKKVIECEMYLDNRCTVMDREWLERTYRGITNWDVFQREQEKILKKFGIEVEDTMVSAIVGTKGIKNFYKQFPYYLVNLLGMSAEIHVNKKFWDREDSNKLYYRLIERYGFPEFFPYSLLKGLRDGDMLILNLNCGYEFHITIRDSEDYEFRRFMVYKTKNIR